MHTIAYCSVMKWINSNNNIGYYSNLRASTSHLVFFSPFFSAPKTYRAFFPQRTESHLHETMREKKNSADRRLQKHTQKYNILFNGSSSSTQAHRISEHIKYTHATTFGPFEFRATDESEIGQEFSPYIMVFTVTVFDRQDFIFGHITCGASNETRWVESSRVENQETEYATHAGYVCTHNLVVCRINC